MRRATSPATPNSTCTCRSPTRRTRPRSRPPASSSQRWKCKARPPPAARRPRRAPPRHPPAATEPRLSFHRKALLRKGLSFSWRTSVCATLAGVLRTCKTAILPFCHGTCLGVRHPLRASCGRAKRQSWRFVLGPLPMRRNLPARLRYIAGVPAARSSMIETERLTRRYGQLTAVDALSIRAEPGQVLGLLGPNGAGKSTAMRMIAGFLAPTSGTARVCGYDVQRAPLAARRALGYLPEGAPSYGEMTVREFLVFIARMRKLTAEVGHRRFDEVVGWLQLEDVLEAGIDTLSKGLRRRVGLAQAILHDPPVLMLDEPTDGLDPNQKHTVRQLIDAMARERTILISTHLLEEVHALCNRVVIVARGKLLADATPAELEARSRYHGAVSFSAP